MTPGATLNPELNICPEAVKHIHIIGICGTGMAAMAGMLKQNGYRVTGSDQSVYPPMSDFLVSCGIDILEGYSAGNLRPRPDLVIVGNVVRAVNPEAIELAIKKIPYLSMPQALGIFFLNDRRSLVVTGTHGKTTTSSMLAATLHRVGNTPGFMIGGIVEAFGRNFNVSDEPYFVVEGDEYDTAFFNKVSKFQHYLPECAILTSVEFDHADIFSSIDDIKASFAEFIARLPIHGVLIANFDDAIVRELSRNAKCLVISYGTGEEAQWRIKKIIPDGLATKFEVNVEGDLLGPYSIPMPGIHNVMNGVAVMALMNFLGFSNEASSNGLSLFEGVKRRQQIRGCEFGVTVIDDFAHHPTAVKITVEALKASYGDKRLIVVFEPRTNSSRRAIFQSDYALAFDAADFVLIREHTPLENIPTEEQFSSSRLARDICQGGSAASCFPDTEAILLYLTDYVQKGDVVVILSNGGFENIHERLLTILRELS